jgi:co-chaperonin GroES (HSP10)
MIPIAVGDNVICQEVADSGKTAGGLYIPETAQAQLPQKNAIVVSIGEKCEAHFRAGDTVVCHTQAGQVMVYGKDVYFVLKEPEIYGIVERVDESMTEEEVVEETLKRR